jgi:hypothetical protein
MSRLRADRAKMIEIARSYNDPALEAFADRLAEGEFAEATEDEIEEMIVLTDAAEWGQEKEESV